MSAATDYVQLTHAASEIDGTIDEVYAARGSYGNLSLKIASKQDELSQSQLAAANSGITAEKLATDEAALAEVVDSGAKNLLKIIATSQTKNGITFSISSDGSVSLNGTATSTTTFALNDQIGLQHGKYILFGIVPRNVYLTARSTSSTNYIVTQNNSEIRIDDDIYYAYINISSGATLDNVVINPMLCTAADWAISQKFVPYCPTMAEMYAMILALQNGTRSTPALAKSEPEEIKEPETGEEETR